MKIFIIIMFALFFMACGKVEFEQAQYHYSNDHVRKYKIGEEIHVDEILSVSEDYIAWYDKTEDPDEIKIYNISNNNIETIIIEDIKKEAIDITHVKNKLFYWTRSLDNWFMVLFVGEIFLYDIKSHDSKEIFNEIRDIYAEYLYDEPEELNGFMDEGSNETIRSIALWLLFSYPYDYSENYISFYGGPTTLHFDELPFHNIPSDIKSCASLLFDINNYTFEFIDDGFGLYPIIFNNKVLWSKCLESSIYCTENTLNVYDINTKEDITISNQLGYYHPEDFNERYMVFSEMREPGNYYPGDFNEMCSFCSIAEENLNKEHEQDNEMDKSIFDLFVFDMLDSREIKITDSEFEKSPARLSGDKVIWSEKEIVKNKYVNEYNWDVYMYDISLGQTYKLTDNESNQAFANIYGENIVWVDDRRGQKDIYLYNLKSDKSRCITCELESENIL